jgi:hypothetical protein
MRNMRIGGAMHRDAQRLVAAIDWLAEHLTGDRDYLVDKAPTTTQPD